MTEINRRKALLLSLLAPFASSALGSTPVIKIGADGESTPPNAFDRLFHPIARFQSHFCSPKVP